VAIVFGVMIAVAIGAAMVHHFVLGGPPPAPRIGG
jgi:hypothetical protein